MNYLIDTHYVLWALFEPGRIPKNIIAIFENEEDKKAEFLRNFLEYTGVPDEQIDKMNLLTIDKLEVAKIIDEHNIKRMTENGNRQKVVLSKEVKKHIECGWEFVSSLPDGSVIIKLPF